ncbi:MAG: hypothetical protein PWQ82_984 [Thermosediminibacterales bacterium]|nr:hypothetical protein [Thermosediminibacterales bacterium]MDK2835838.1 hypothetical protein [Thermosediminibacterales bacterium]
MRDKIVKMTPGSKIYQLFKHKEVLVEGNKEKFLITVRKIENIQRKTN